MRRILPIAVLCVVALAGCSSPSSNLYTLKPTAVVAADQAACSCSVVVGPVSIPEIVNVPQIVVNVGPNQVRLDEFNRWASPLQNNIGRVVAENLVSLLGTPHVTLFQEAVNAAADYHVAVEVQSFESTPGESATLNAVWMVRRTKDGKTQTGRTTVRDPLAQKGYSALVAAHGHELLLLSQDIAAGVRSLGQAPP
jgi:uncharacterized lipoprotein YmbA